MSWENPKTNWGQSGQTVPIADDFNRIEGNIQHLQDTKETPAGAQAKAGAVQAELNTHKAETTQNAHLAKNIGVQDANNRFTGTDVESVLNELFQFANNGKTDIASVIGSPATSGDTFAQLKTHIQNNKNTLATNLTNKGQTSFGTETLAALVAKVANISTGKKVAIGTIGLWTGSKTVSGLGFRPSFVFVWCTSSGTALRMSFALLQEINKPFNYYNGIVPYAYNLFGFRNVSGTISVSESPGTITNDGFTLTDFINDGYSVTYNWIAVE